MTQNTLNYLLNTAQQAETHRTNVANEEIKRTDAETNRLNSNINQQNANTKSAELAEAIRSHSAQERISQEANRIASANQLVNATNAGTRIQELELAKDKQRDDSALKKSQMQVNASTTLVNEVNALYAGDKNAQNWANTIITGVSGAGSVLFGKGGLAGVANTLSK